VLPSFEQIKKALQRYYAARAHAASDDTTQAPAGKVEGSDWEIARIQQWRKRTDKRAAESSMPWVVRCALGLQWACLVLQTAPILHALRAGGVEWVVLGTLALWSWNLALRALWRRQDYRWLLGGVTIYGIASLTFAVGPASVTLTLASCVSLALFYTEKSEAWFAPDGSDAI